MPRSTTSLDGSPPGRPRAGLARFLLLALVAALLAVGAAACGGDDDAGGGEAAQTGDGESGDGGSVVVGISADPASLDPQVVDDRNMVAVNGNIYEPLVDRDGEGKLVPRLAESWEQVADNVMRFKLREGVTFHNGEPFNAEVAAYSVKRIVDPALESSIASFFPSIVDARAVDEYTLEIETDGPDPVLLARLTWLQMVPMEASQEPGFAENPAGTGPYTFEGWTRGQSVEIARNPDYWGEAPAIESATFRVITESETRLSALRTGEIDLAGGILPEQVDLVPKAVVNLSNEHVVIRLNNQGPLADPRVRQAMNYAIDKEAVNEAIFGGQGELLHAQIENPNIFGYNPDIEPYPYDPDRARELVAEAGAENLSFEIIGEGNNNWVKSREVVEAVAAQLSQELGWDVKPRILEWNAFIEAFFSEDKATASILYSGNEFLDADRNTTAYLTCEPVASTFCDEEVDAMVVAARQELDEGTREEMYHELLDTVAYDDPAFLYLVQSPDIWGMSERLEFQPRPDSKIIVSTMAVNG